MRRSAKGNEPTRRGLRNGIGPQRRTRKNTEEMEGVNDPVRCFFNHGLTRMNTDETRAPPYPRSSRCESALTGLRVDSILERAYARCYITNPALIRRLRTDGNVAQLPCPLSFPKGREGWGEEAASENSIPLTSFLSPLGRGEEDNFSRLWMFTGPEMMSRCLQPPSRKPSFFHFASHDRRGRRREAPCALRQRRGRQRETPGARHDRPDDHRETFLPRTTVE